LTSRYAELGLEPIINASATLTRLGGSRMPEEVLAAMAEAAECFVDLPLLQERVGAKIAELTRNEAAYVSSGAAAGIVLAVASCVTGTDKSLVLDFPQLKQAKKTEVILWKASRNGYDFAVTQTGVTVIEIGSSAAEFEAAINERTACAVWFAGPLGDNALPIEEVIRIGKARGVPILVDAAAQIPPVESFWHYTRDLGATGVIFSGGKGIRGPQSSGLILGTKELIAGARINGPPNHSIGRGMKVGKEEMLGCLAAVEYTLNQDEAAQLGEYDEIVHRWIEDLANLPGVTTERRYPSEAGQPHARTILHIGADAARTRDQIVTELWEGSPKIAVAPLDREPDALALNPQTLTKDESDIVSRRIREILGKA